MAKAPKNSNHQKKILVVLFIEGDTEVEFYKKLIDHLRYLHGGSLSCDVKVLNVKGVGKFQSKVNRIFEKRIKPKYDAKVYEYQVFLSYDTDVFEFTRKPLVDWKSVNCQLLSLGAHEVYEIEAKSSIEDCFLFDPEGIRSFLKISQSVDISRYHGLDGLQKLFFKANKAYVKGAYSKGLVDSLHMDVIFPKICSQIHTLCKACGIKCNRKLCQGK